MSKIIAEQDARIAFQRALVARPDLAADALNEARFHINEAFDHLCDTHGYDPSAYAYSLARRAMRAYVFGALMGAEPTTYPEFRALEKKWYRKASREQRKEEKVVRREEYGPQPGDKDFVTDYDRIFGRHDEPLQRPPYDT